MDVVLEGYLRFDKVIRATSERFGVTYVPAGKFGQLQSLSWFADGDPIHFSDVGADQMAQHLARAIVSAGLITSSASGVASDN